MAAAAMMSSVSTARATLASAPASRRVSLAAPSAPLLGSSASAARRGTQLIARREISPLVRGASVSVEATLSFGKSKAPKQKLKTVILTGASSGLGLATLKSLMADGNWHVICGVRNIDKMQDIIDDLGYPREMYSIYPLELKSKDSVKAFVKKFRGSGRTLDVLCCNAAVYLPNQPAPTMGDYGFEESLTVNHLSHFLLVNMMIPDLKKSKEPRCIIVGSITGNTNTVGGGAVAPHANLGTLSGLASKQVMVDGLAYNGAKAYKDSKLANMMTVLELHKRYHEKTGIVFSSMYPGCIAETDLFRQKRGWFRWFFPIFMKYVTGGYVSQEEAGDRLFQTIADPRCAKSGVYWSWNGGARSPGVYNPVKGEVQGAGGAGGELFENVPSQACRDVRKAEKLWELSEKAVGLSN